MTDLARQRYGPDLGESYTPMRDLFYAQAVEHAASIHGMLFLSASLASFSRPTKAAESKVAALHHRGLMLEQINGALAKSDLSMPGLIQAIGFQVVYEAGLPWVLGDDLLICDQGVAGNYNSCRRHLTGMRSIVLAMGGPATLAKEPRVQMIFIYLSLDTTTDYLPLPVIDPLYTFSDPSEVPRMVYQTQKEFAEVSTFLNDTLDFLQQIQALSEHGWSYGLITEAGDFNPFGPDTLFHHILSPQWLPPTLIPGHILGQHRTTRIACLLLLCQALLALKAPSQACDKYMMQQVDVILIERADEKPDLRPVLHLLMKDRRGVRLRDLDVAYRASRNAQIIKRLSLPMHDRVGRVLLGCLAGGRANAERLLPADFERIRDEALMFQPP